MICRPGRLRAFCALPPSELTDAIVDGAQVFGANPCAMLEQQLREAGDRAARIAVIERFLLDRLQPSAGWKRLPEALEDVYCCLPRMSIADLGEHFRLTPRTLQRRFRGTFGVSPKVFTRITRVHVALWHLDHARRLGLDSLAHVAHRVGYSDQAHFSRDFRAMVGVTPARTLSMLEQCERMAWRLGAARSDRIDTALRRARCRAAGAGALIPRCFGRHLVVCAANLACVLIGARR